MFIKYCINFVSLLFPHLDDVVFLSGSHKKSEEFDNADAESSVL